MNEYQVESVERRRILIAEDDVVTRRLLARFLNSAGYEVIEAADGREAWRLFEIHRPRLVITDWRMPHMDGLTLCSNIRGDQADDYVYVLILTAATEQDAVLEGFAAGADDFMTKPFKRAELEWRVNSGMRVIRLQGALESRIQELKATHAQLESANREMQAGLVAAGKVQRSLLPKVAPDVSNVKCAWAYSPSAHLGGDSLNVFKLDGNRIGFFVADVCGHGVPSALLAFALHRVLTPTPDAAGILAAEAGVSADDIYGDPGRVLTEINRRFPMKVEQGEYFTAVYGVLDTYRGELKYSGAGHPHPVLLGGPDPPRRLCTDGLPVGFLDDVVYETTTIQLQPGDRLCLFTDGVLEAANADRQMFGDQRLVDVLERTIDQPVDAAVSELVAEVQLWSHSPADRDDVSVVLVEWAGAPVAADAKPAARKRAGSRPAPPPLPRRPDEKPPSPLDDTDQIAVADESGSAAAAEAEARAGDSPPPILLHFPAPAELA